MLRAYPVSCPVTTVIARENCRFYFPLTSVLPAVDGVCYMIALDTHIPLFEKPSFVGTIEKRLG